MEHELVDVQESHRISPLTFQVPPEERLDALMPGDFAKLFFVTGLEWPKVERMWVEIVGRGEGGYVGTLANDPGCMENIRYGDLVRFQQVHVADTHLAGESW